jgi:hypothetical protein
VLIVEPAGEARCAALAPLAAALDAAVPGRAALPPQLGARPARFSGPGALLALLDECGFDPPPPLLSY